MTETLDTNKSPKPSSQHPLEHTWLLTYKPNKPPPPKGLGYVKKQQQSENDWLSAFQKVYLINTVELFWQVYNNILKWSKLSNGSIYAFFKEGINPSWEDPANKEGCSYMFYMNQNKIREDDLDKIFESALAFLIGGWSDYAEAVNGITFERKQRGDKMIVWCNSHSDEMLRCIRKEMFPEDMVDLVSLESEDINNNTFKVSTKIVDHKSELARLSIPSKHNSANHQRHSDKK
jgi:translation initiation factor 4E